MDRGPMWSGASSPLSAPARWLLFPSWIRQPYGVRCLLRRWPLRCRGIALPSATRRALNASSPHRWENTERPTYPPLKGKLPMKALKRVHVNVNGAPADGKITPALRGDMRPQKGDAHDTQFPSGLAARPSAQQRATSHICEPRRSKRCIAALPKARLGAQRWAWQRTTFCGGEPILGAP